MRRIAFACCVLAIIAAAFAGCTKDKIDEDSMVGYKGQFASRNADFEQDWASQSTITLVTDYYKENDKPVVKTIEVPLPWAWEEGPQQWLPQYTARNMAELDSDDWRLVFNLTGIDQKPGEHYFGLYNRYTGILRVFFYLTEKMVPASDANDHMWVMGLSKDLLEHVIYQFAIPYSESVTDTYKNALGGNDAVFKTTAFTSSCTDDGKVIPAVGWWAYDIDMSAMRPHDFFSSDRSIMRPGMNVFNQDNVVLTSLMHGSLDGTLSGNINLNSLKGSGTTIAGRLCGGLGGFAGSLLTNCTFLSELFSPTGLAGAGITALIGVGIGTIAKTAESSFQKGMEDPDKLGDINGKINLTLDATIETVGTIGGERTTVVPSPELNVATFFKKKTPAGEPTCLGEGVWNIANHPVIYVVKDAYWGDKPKFSSVEKIQSEGRDAYQLTIDPDNLGLRLISFLDPSSIGRVRVNPNAVPANILGKMSVRVSYGVLNAAAPGYTNGFRKAIGLEYTNPEITDKSAYQSDDEGVGFKVIKKYHGDEIFQTFISDDDKDILAHRLSQQQIGEKIHRRLWGASAYYCKKNATADELDDVMMVADPEVYLPVNSADRLLFNTDLPDFIVTAVLSLKGIENGEEVVQVHSLKFIPKIEFISVNDLEKVYEEIRGRCINLPTDNVDYPQLQEDLAKIKQLVDNAK